jgi:hypothetical protein
MLEGKERGGGVVFTQQTTKLVFCLLSYFDVPTSQTTKEYDQSICRDYLSFPLNQKETLKNSLFLERLI